MTGDQLRAARASRDAAAAQTSEGELIEVTFSPAEPQLTIGYKAVYPAEAIEAHRAFIARRRATRPSEEYRTPTEEERDAFLAHFEKRKVSVGTCARAFASPCVHEHACLTEMILSWNASPPRRQA